VRANYEGREVVIPGRPIVFGQIGWRIGAVSNVPERCWVVAFPPLQNPSANREMAGGRPP
jgi:hypothetical protein